MRDDAELGRSSIVNAILATTGNDGWKAKLEMADDPLFANLKDRVIAIARERAAEEADGAPWKESHVADLGRRGEVPPTTRDSMFTLVSDRLDDIDDLLLQDFSPREIWAAIGDERLMRREITRELYNRANHLYTIDQEAVTADEKETDIRIRSTSSAQQAAIEIKIGDKDRSAAELRASLKDQLLAKYMAADNCRSGYLVVTVASNRYWKHPDNGAQLNFAELIEMLNEEAKKLSLELGGSVRLMAKGIDLQPRLETERHRSGN
jgi:hypothetical protein